MSLNLETANLISLKTLRSRTSRELPLAQLCHLVDRITTICKALTSFSCDPELERHCLDHVKDLIVHLKKVSSHNNSLTANQLGLLKQAYANFQCWRMTTNSHPHLNSEKVGAVCTAFDRIIN
mgnify:CR=1 FL=1